MAQLFPLILKNINDEVVDWGIRAGTAARKRKKISLLLVFDRQRLNEMASYLALLKYYHNNYFS